MLSLEIRQALLEAKEHQGTYVPDDEICEALGNKALLGVVGPSCIGKSTLMNKVAEIYPKYKRAKGFTTRQPRPDDEPGQYEYINHDNHGISDFLKQRETRSLVQYAITPESDDMHVYGTRIEDYPGEYNMKDIWWNAVDNFQSLPFKTVQFYFLYSSPYTWMNRYRERYPDMQPGSEGMRRLKGDLAIFNWFRNQKSENLRVLKVDDDAETCAAKFDEMVKTSANNDLDSRHVINKMEKVCQQRINNTHAK